MIEKHDVLTFEIDRTYSIEETRDLADDLADAITAAFEALGFVEFEQAEHDPESPYPLRTQLKHDGTAVQIKLHVSAYPSSPTPPTVLPSD